MTESQAHGFTWEKSVLEGVYGITEPQVGGYTRVHDVSPEENKLDGAAVSIKTAGSSSVDMGDARRVFQACSSGEPFHLLLLQYEQEVSEKVLKSVSYVDLTSSAKELFGNLTLEDIAAMHAHLKEIPTGRASIDTRTEYKVRAAELSRKSGAISLRPKVDSKKQRRLQCSFSNIRAFCAENPRRLISQSDEGVFKGFQLLKRVQSGRRQRQQQQQQREA
jgi:hypothetical protein